MVDSLLTRIEAIERYVASLPSDFVLKYKPPGEYEHLDLSDVLDDLYMKINRIEAIIQK